jgi:hypothetical protein
VSRVHSRTPAEVTIKTEGRTMMFKISDWDLELERPRIDVSNVGSPNLVWVDGGPTRGRLEFCIYETNENVSPDEEVDMRLAQIKRYMKLLGVPDDV